MPYSNNNWLPVSTSEWMPSDIIAELPVTDAAINLVTDISALPISAAIMTRFEPDAIFCPQQFQRNYIPCKQKPQQLFVVRAY
jgi:hypothetical protein